jgi:hypothetical protein
VRKTERRLPAGFQAADLGEAVSVPDGRCALISFSTAPIVVGRANTYVLMVTDAALASSAQSFEWTFSENGDIARVVTGAAADVVYAPAALGSLAVTVKILGAGGVELAVLSLEQLVVIPSAELEALIGDAQNKPGPGASNPEVLRELVNQHCRYYQDVTPRNPEPGDAFLRFVFSMAANGAGRQTPDERRKHIERLAGALEQNPEEFPVLAATGVGVANIRLALLAMVQPQAGGSTTPFLPWQELPETNPQRAFADEQLRAKLVTLSEDARIDLLNIARFPKSNLAACARILEALRDRYFAGAKFEDVLTGMSGTRAHWIATHFSEGPIARA